MFKVNDWVRFKNQESGTKYQVETIHGDHLRLKNYIGIYSFNEFEAPEGFKDDSSKPNVDLVFSSFPRALLELSKVADHGAKKYTKDGWVSVENGQKRYASALGRHILKRHIEGELDSESNLYHLAHMAWNALAVLELKLREQ